MPRFQSILIPVPEAEMAVEPFRREGDWSSAHGVPTHMTIAGPWPLSVSLPLDALVVLAAEARGLRFVLGEVGYLGDAISLFPEDDDKLLRLRAAFLDAVGTPDAIDENWRLHLTVCRGATPELRAEVEASIGDTLPIACEVNGLLLAQMDDSRVTIRRL
jgi:2'-5' RNA ligase superfamily